MFLPQREIVCKNFWATGKNFLSFEKISCDRKKFSITGKNFLTQDEFCCHRKIYAVTAKKNPVTGRNFLPQ